MRFTPGLLVVLLSTAVVAACGDNQTPAAADAMWRSIQDARYRTFPRAPGFETRKPSNAAHGDAVDIFVNKTIADALAAKKPLASWPVGSLIVKDGYDGGELEFVAVMEKRDDGWFWAEYDGEGNTIYSGKPSLCIDCHASGQDEVRAFGLPK